jgi:RNA polymerase sigma factor (sigma-70 family)
MIENKDTDLWNRFRQGEEQALYTLYDQYYHLLLFLGLKICARSEPVKDCIQQVFLYLWEKKEGLGTVTNVRSYIITSFKRKLLLQLQQEKKDNGLLSLWIHQEPGDDIPSGEQLLIHQQQSKEAIGRIQEAITLLSPRQKELINLRFYEGRNYEEIVDITGLTHRTVYNHLYEALKSLKQSLKQDLKSGNLNLRMLLLLLPL